MDFSKYPLWFDIILIYLIGAASMTPIILKCFKSIIHNNKKLSNKHAKDMLSNPTWRIKIIVTISLWPFFLVQLIKETIISKLEK